MDLEEAEVETVTLPEEFEVHDIKKWSEMVGFWMKYPHLKSINRLSQMSDIKGLRIVPEDLLAKSVTNLELNDKVSQWSGDITRLKVDAIVNPAHPTLAGGGGVDGYIHLKAGENLLEECLQLGPCQMGEVKLSKGYQLSAKFIIHTVGPTREDPEVLENCYWNSLNLLKEKGLKTIAFPCIATGNYSYPIVNATKIALSTTRKWLETEENRHKVDRIIFNTYTVRDEAVYQALLPAYFPG